MDKQIYLTITIDTECDKGPGWLTQHPLQFKSVVEAIPHQFEPLFHKYGAKATYLLSPEVIKNDNCVRILKKTLANGADLGTHLHGEFIEPYPDYRAKITSTMQNTYSKEIEFAKLKNLTKIFRDQFGFQPTSFRAGRFGMSRHTLSILAELGYKVDSSVAPFTQWNDNGGKIHFFGTPTQPYYPDEKDFRKQGNLPILEAPLTIGNCWYEFLPKFILRSVPYYSKIWGFLQKHLGLKEQFKPLWLRPTLKASTEENMKKLILHNIHQSNTPDVFLVMMFHNVDFLPGCSPYAQTEKEAKHFFRRLEDILVFTKQLPVEFITLSEITSKISHSIPTTLDSNKVRNFCR